MFQSVIQILKQNQVKLVAEEDKPAKLRHKLGISEAKNHRLY